MFLVLDWLEAIVLSAVQGVSSVLPLSDSGFTAIARRLLGLPLNGSGDRLFSSILRILIALVIFLTFRQDWIHALRHIPQRRGRKPTIGQTKALLGRRMLLLMMVGFVFSLPGLFVNQYAQVLQTQFMRLSLIMIPGGLLIFTCDRVGHGKRTITEATVKDALLVGLFQALGMIPGLSPVGLGIVMGIWLGMEPSFSIRFSCLLLAPSLVLQGIWGIAVSAEAGSFALSWIPAALVCILCTYLSLRLLRFVSQRRTLGDFALPIWGASVFTFILYLFS